MSLSTKSEIRSYYKKLRQELSPERKAEMDEKITQSFLSLDEYNNCSTILAFVSKGIEVNTEGVINRALSDGKTVAVPRCGEKGSMSFLIIKSRDDLENGYYDIPEPKAYCSEIRNFEN